MQIVQLAATGAALIDGGVESGFTLGLADNATITIDMDNAAAGAADVLNVELNAENDTTFGVVEADDVETLNIAVTDVDGTDDADTDATFNASLNDVDTINVSGALDGTFTLTFDADVADKVDASGFDGNIILDASGNTDNITLIGGSGDDILTGGAGKDTMTGGDGDDIFAITDAPTVGTAPEPLLISVHLMMQLLYQLQIHLLALRLNWIRIWQCSRITWMQQQQAMQVMILAGSSLVAILMLFRT